MSAFLSPRNWSNAPRNAPSERTSKRRDAYLILQQEMVRILTPAESSASMTRACSPSSWWSASSVPARPPPSAKWPTGTRTAGEKLSSARLTPSRRGHRIVSGLGRTRRLSISSPTNLRRPRRSRLRRGARPARKSRQADLLIVDTAGRLQTKYNLMQNWKRSSVKPPNRCTVSRMRSFWCSMIHRPNAISQAKSFKDKRRRHRHHPHQARRQWRRRLSSASTTNWAYPSVRRHHEQIADFAEFDPVAFVEGLVGQ